MARGAVHTIYQRRLAERIHKLRGRNRDLSLCSAEGVPPNVHFGGSVDGYFANRIAVQMGRVISSMDHSTFH